MSLSKDSKPYHSLSWQSDTKGLESYTKHYQQCYHADPPQYSNSLVLSLESDPVLSNNTEISMGL